MVIRDPFKGLSDLEPRDEKVTTWIARQLAIYFRAKNVTCIYNELGSKPRPWGLMHNPLATMVRVATSEEHNFSNYFIPFVCGCLSFQLYISTTWGKGRCFFFDGILPANVWWNLIFWVPRSWFIHPPLGWPKKGRTKNQGHDVWGFSRWKKMLPQVWGWVWFGKPIRLGWVFFFVILVEWFFILVNLVTSPPQKRCSRWIAWSGIQGETLPLFQVVTFFSLNVGGHQQPCERVTDHHPKKRSRWQNCQDDASLKTNMSP